MKSEFKSRPVYLSRDDRIKAHFLTCFISLFIFRILEQSLNSKFTSSEILKTLRSMQFQEIPRDGFIPAYIRNEITDALHQSVDFITDYEVITMSDMRKIYNVSKKA